SEAKDELEPSSDEPKPKPKLKTLSDSNAATRKLAITRLLQYQHPTSTLNVGTLSANLRRALPNDGTVQQEVALCIRNAVREAARIKRQGQRVIGKFVEHVNKHGPGLNDRRFMNCLCPRVSMKDAKKLDDGCAAEDDDEDGGDMDQKSKDGKGSEQFLFLQSFLVYLYSGNYPRKSGTGQKVNDFIDRLKDLGLYAPPRPRAALNETTPFSPTELLLSVALQLKVELKKMYRNGTCELHNKRGFVDCHAAKEYNKENQGPVSVNFIRRALHDIGMRAKKFIKKPMLKPHHKKAHLEFIKKHQRFTGDD
ncbi:hypothetical protein BGZ54_004709, partial [Gamsiella multidivaricata]